MYFREKMPAFGKKQREKKEKFQLAGRQQNEQEIVTFVGQDSTAFDMILLTGGKAVRTKSPEE